MDEPQPTHRCAVLQVLEDAGEPLTAAARARWVRVSIGSPGGMSHAEMDARIAAIRAWRAAHPVLITDAMLRDLDQHIRERRRWEARCARRAAQEARRQRCIEALIQRRVRILAEIAAVTEAVRYLQGARRHTALPSPGANHD